ncbi:hypothetical protein SARC_16176, partial [Sphaeroforma arctica JP610]
MPVIQLWDLRNAYAPVRALEGHSRGILAMAWCPKDGDMLLSTAKDNRSIVWNPNSAQGQEIVTELPPCSNWRFDAQWSARNPLLLATSSFAGTMTVFNIADNRPD